MDTEIWFMWIVKIDQILIDRTLALFLADHPAPNKRNVNKLGASG
jgi:hypothetical protein